MNMENIQQNNELELMRCQMEDFKAQLHQQKIVNEKLIISSTKKGMSWIKKYVVFEICLVPLITLVWFGIKEFAGLSWFNYLFLVLMLIADVVADYRINVSAINDADYSRDNLVTTITKLERMKRQRYQAMLVTVPMLIIWFVWTFIETWLNFPADVPDFIRGAFYGGMAGGVLGIVLGLVFAFRIYFKMQQTNDEMISQLEGLS